MIVLDGFQGETPRIHPKRISSQNAQIALDCRLENGQLLPVNDEAYLQYEEFWVRVPATSDPIEYEPFMVEAGLGYETFNVPILQVEEDVVTIYKDGENWLTWEVEVDVTRHAVATDRLYYTGDGAPKMRVASTVYGLALPAPAAKPAATLRSMLEFLNIEDRKVRLRNGQKAYTGITGISVSVSVSGNVATVTLSRPNISTAQMQTIITGISYTTEGVIVPGLRKIQITQISDSGGQQYDSFGNPIGSDTRYLENVGAVLRLGGTALDYTFGTAPALDATDVPDQNDPPTLVATGTKTLYVTGDSDRQLFTAATVGTIEGGQNITRLVLTVEGLATGEPDLAPSDQTTAESLVYTYTWVTSFGEESQPAPLSDARLWSQGNSVRLSGMSTVPPAGRGVVAKRIYRSQTSASGRTDLFFIAEIDEAEATFDDEVDARPLQEPIPSLDYNPPVSTLKGLTSMPNGMMAGFSGADLYFCEPYQPHAWPVKYGLKVDAPIVGLAAFGSSLAIMTTAQPYVVQGTHPAQMVMEKLEVNYPCSAKGSIVDMGEYAAYASDEGLVLISNAGARLISRAMFTRRQWAEMNTETFQCGQRDGQYVISYDDESSPAQRKVVVIDLEGQVPFLVRSSAAVKSFHLSGTTLYYLSSTQEIRIFDPDVGTTRPYRWRSKIFESPVPVNYGAIKISADLIETPAAIEARIYADGILVDTITEYDVIRRLRGRQLAYEYEIELRGNVGVTSVVLANAPSDLRRLT